MKKSCSDQRVRKTLVRNCEQKIRQPLQPRVAHDLEMRVTCSMPDRTSELQKETELSKPTPCSSEVLANYLCDIKKSMPQQLSTEDFNVEKEKISAKVTKKLNFHINNRIYNNLIELNANIEDIKTRREKRPPSRAVTSKRDQEPDIKDFFEEEKEVDFPPKVPLIRPKFKPIRKVENGQLHKLVAAFDVL